MIETPPFAKIFIVFAIMLALGRLRIPLAVSLLLGGGALNYWGGNTFLAVIGNFGQALAQINLWLLVAVTALIVEFGRELADERNAEIMLSFARKIGGRNARVWSLMFMPALIGLVPMPAGAMFSAPLVQQSAFEDHWKPEWKAAVNYWFRHVWEYWWPVYTVVIIGMAVFQMEAWRFMTTMIAFTPAAFLTGYYFLLRPHLRELAGGGASAGHSVRAFIILLFPLLVIIASVLALPPLFNRAFPGIDAQTGKLVSMLIGILAGILLIRSNAAPRTKMFASFLEKRNMTVLTTIACIIVFQSLLESSRLLPAASRDLINSGISIVPIVALLPFLAGFITGVASGFAGIAFPLIAGLAGTGAGGISPMAILALSFGFGYMGMMLSPIHLCLLMTRDYFSASLWPIYRQISLCVAAQMAFTIAVFAILNALKI